MFKRDIMRDIMYYGFKTSLNTPYTHPIHPIPTLYPPYTSQPSGDLTKFMICPYKGHLPLQGLLGREMGVYKRDMRRDIVYSGFKASLHTPYTPDTTLCPPYTHPIPPTPLAT